MSTLFVDTINEKTSGNGIKIQGASHSVCADHSDVQFNLNHNSGLCDILD